MGDIMLFFIQNGLFYALEYGTCLIEACLFPGKPPTFEKPCIVVSVCVVSQSMACPACMWVHQNSTSPIAMASLYVAFLFFISTSNASCHPSPAFNPKDFCPFTRIHCTGYIIIHVVYVGENDILHKSISRQLKRTLSRKHCLIFVTTFIINVNRLRWPSPGSLLIPHLYEMLLYALYLWTNKAFS